jgi:hypothetical protein
MRKYNYQLILIACLVLIVSINACKKSYLDRAPLGTLDQTVLANAEGVQGLLIGAYSMLDGAGGASSSQGSTASNWTYSAMGSDEAYKGSALADGGPDLLPIETKTALSPTNTYVIAKWNHNYEAIQRCNDVIRIMPTASDIGADKQKIIAGEARFLRAFYHFELKKVFNKAPYVDETLTVSQGEVSNANDIWTNIEADFQFAVDNLPEIQPQVGRVNKWAAMAFLAKVYLYQHKYAQAKPLFDQVIANGKTSKGERYDLLTNYFSNFNPAEKNSKECVFAAQTSVNDGSGSGGLPNGNFPDIANYPYGPGSPVGCCGILSPSQDLGNAFKTDAATGLPLFDTYFNGGTTDAPTLYSGTVDPRIDWTIGRPGVPYVDWGIQPAETWIRSVPNQGYFLNKKNMYAQSQQDEYSDHGAFWSPAGVTAINVLLMRFADVLLMAAEAEIEAGSTSKALEYVNRVRARAANPNGWVYKNSAYNADKAEYVTKTDPAANYEIGLYTAAQFADKAFATKAVRFERRLELAMEGHRFFDLQRWDNGTGSMADILNAMYQRDANLVAYKKDAKFVKGKHEYYPIPQTEIDLLNNDGVTRLTQNPGY